MKKQALLLLKIMDLVMTKNNLRSDFDINELENRNIEQQILALLI